MTIEKLWAKAQKVSPDASVQILWVAASGGTLREIAEFLGCSMTAIYKRYQRALFALDRAYPTAGLLPLKKETWINFIQNNCERIKIYCRDFDFGSNPLDRAQYKPKKAQRTFKSLTASEVSELKSEITEHAALCIDGRLSFQNSSFVSKIAAKYNVKVNSVYYIRDLIEKEMAGVQSEIAEEKPTELVEQTSPELATFTHLEFPLDLKTPNGLWWKLFQLSTETDVFARVRNVDLVLKIEDIYDATLDELNYFVNNPTEIINALATETKMAA